MSSSLHLAESLTVVVITLTAGTLLEMMPYTHLLYPTWSAGHTHASSTRFRIMWISWLKRSAQDIGDLLVHRIEFLFVLNKLSRRNVRRFLQPTVAAQRLWDWNGAIRRSPTMSTSLLAPGYRASAPSQKGIARNQLRFT